MAAIRAGFGKSDITPRVGCAMGGYRNRISPSVGVHDPLLSRALVVEGDDALWALSANDLLELMPPTVALVRDKVSARVPIERENIHVSAVHTHAAHYDRDPQDWDPPLADRIAAAIVWAYENRLPARTGGGLGRLDGWSINRRFLDRPVDPGVGILRIDDLEGNPLGAVVNWGCHAAVLGHDNLLISADFPGVMSRTVEERLGGESVALFVNGGAGDVNPLVRGVRERLDGGYTVTTMVPGIFYYGTADGSPQMHIGDRRGGTFEEVSELGTALGNEAWKVFRAIETGDPPRAPWAETAELELRLPTAPPFGPKVPPYLRGNTKGVAEVAAFGVGDVAFVSEPGEVFAETFVGFKRRMRQLGYRTPMAISCMDGFFWYLTPAEALPDGGMEVELARQLGLREDLHEVMWQALESILVKYR
jgi:hypothetical protein